MDYGGNPTDAKEYHTQQQYVMSENDMGKCIAQRVSFIVFIFCTFVVEQNTRSTTK